MVVALSLPEVWVTKGQPLLYNISCPHVTSARSFFVVQEQKRANIPVRSRLRKGQNQSQRVEK
jgi:hypothetical protein